MKFIFSVLMVATMMVNSFILHGTVFSDETTEDATFSQSFVSKKVKKSVAIKDKNQLWKFGIIPYEFDNVFDEPDLKLIKLGMRIWEISTCIEFIERNPQTDYDYVVITKLNCGCCFIERDPRNIGRSEMSLNDGCVTLPTVLHELGHVLGLHHEHEHPDRDHYVFINHFNIERGYRTEFGKFSNSEVDTLGRPYDYRSVMHYPADAFARSDFLKTIVPLQSMNGTIPKIGNQVKLSEGDISAVNILYNCSDCRRTLYHTQGTIRSPNFPNNDPLSIVNCAWNIPVSSGNKVALKILSLNIPKSPDCIDNYLEVRKGFSDQNDLLGRYCGNYSNLLIISDDMTVSYVRTSRSNEDDGFTANYYKICGGEKSIMSNSYITIQSPNYPSDYEPNNDCLWEFSAPRNHTSTIYFEYFNLEMSDDCTMDKVQIGTHDDERLFVETYCGKRSPWNITIDHDKFFVNFQSDEYDENAGFSAIVTTVPREN